MKKKLTTKSKQESVQSKLWFVQRWYGMNNIVDLTMQEYQKLCLNKQTARSLFGPYKTKEQAQKHLNS